MSAIDVLARSLYETSTAGSRTIPKVWGSLDLAEQDAWVGQAEVVAARMVESEPGVTGPAEPLTPETAVDAFVNAAVQLNEIGIGKPDPAEAVRALDRIRYAIDQAKYVDSGLVTYLYLRHEHGKTTYDGIGVVEVSRTRDRKAWDIRGVCQAVLDKHMEHRGGELPNDPWEIVEAILEVLPGGEPRLTPIRTLGLRPDDFHTNLPGNPVVRLPPRT